MKRNLRLRCILESVNKCGYQIIQFNFYSDSVLIARHTSLILYNENIQKYNLINTSKIEVDTNRLNEYLFEYNKR